MVPAPRKEGKCKAHTAAGLETRRGWVTQPMPPLQGNPSGRADKAALCVARLAQAARMGKAPSSPRPLAQPTARMPSTKWSIHTRTLAGRKRCEGYSSQAVPE